MAKLFGDILMNDESLFKDEGVLDYDYLPEELPGRETELRVIAESIKPLFNKRKASNLFINGKPGIGKTACTRYVLKEMKESSNSLMPIYINCWDNQTTHAAILKISQSLGLLFPPKGIPTEEITQQCLNKLRDKKGAVICFDEIDRLKEKDVLYSLLELPNAAFILITNDRESINSLEPRLLSRLCLNNLEFNEYNPKQLTSILMTRAKQAFHPGVISSELIGLIAEKASGDVRRGIGLMIESGRAAERDASRLVKEVHITKAIERLNSVSIKALDGNNKIIYELIKNNSGLTTGKLYSKYCEVGGDLSMRSFRRYINDLESAKLIKTIETSEGFKGKSRIIKVN